MPLVRRSGVGRDRDGATVWWSVAEGRRGRRWREARLRGGALVHSLLLETDPERRFSHLELATPAGLLTLHPEPDATLHGNVLVADGLRHVVGLPWDRDALVLLEGSPLAAAAAVHLLARLQPPEHAPPGVATSHPALRIDGRLRLERAQVDVVAVAPDAYELADVGRVVVDAVFLPVLDDARSWSLEQGADPAEGAS